VGRDRWLPAAAGSQRSRPTADAWSVDRGAGAQFI